MATEVRRLTIEDLERFPDDDGNRYELIDGVLYVSKAPHAEHQSVIDETGDALRAWHRRTGLGYVVSGAGVIFSRFNGVIPDLLWFGDERLAGAMINPDTGEWDGHFYAAPDLAIEVLSPGAANEQRDRAIKLDLYARQGVREYWILDRFSQTVAVYRRDGATLALAATLTDADTLTSPLLPGFAAPVADLFRLPPALRGR